MHAVETCDCLCIVIAIYLEEYYNTETVIVIYYTKI